MLISVSVVVLLTLISYLSRLATTAPPTTTTGPVPTMEPPAYLYKNTADYHWPLFSDNATKIIDGGNAEKWSKEDGIGEGPFSMGSSVKFKEGQVCRTNITKWKFNDSSFNQILREINFVDSRGAKSAIFAILGAVNFVHLVNFSLQKVQKIIKINI